MTMTAKDLFTIGQRVMLSEAGLSHLHRSPWTRRGPVIGTVVGFSTDPECVAILRDGLKTPSTYHASFWKGFDP